MNWKVQKCKQSLNISENGFYKQVWTELVKRKEQSIVVLFV